MRRRILLLFFYAAGLGEGTGTGAGTGAGAEAGLPLPLHRPRNVDVQSSPTSPVPADQAWPQAPMQTLALLASNMSSMANTISSLLNETAALNGSLVMARAALSACEVDRADVSSRLNDQKKEANAELAAQAASLSAQAAIELASLSAALVAQGAANVSSASAHAAAAVMASIQPITVTITTTTATTTATTVMASCPAPTTVTATCAAPEPAPLTTCAVNITKSVTLKTPSPTPNPSPSPSPSHTPNTPVSTLSIGPGTNYGFVAALIGAGILGTLATIGAWLWVRRIRRSSGPGGQNHSHDSPERGSGRLTKSPPPERKPDLHLDLGISGPVGLARPNPPRPPRYTPLSPWALMSYDPLRHPRPAAMGTGPGPGPGPGLASMAQTRTRDSGTTGRHMSWWSTSTPGRPQDMGWGRWLARAGD